MKYQFLYLTSFFLSISITALAQKSQLQIARNAVGKLQVSISTGEDKKKQLAILGEGIKASESAQADKKTKKYSETWAVKAYLTSYAALIDDNQGNADRNVNLAIAAVDSAKRLDKYQDNSGLIEASIYNINVKKVEQGNTFFSKKDFTNAFKALSQASEFFPKDTLIAMNTALSAVNLQDYQNAIDFFNRAKANGAKDPALFQTLTNIYISKFDYDAAVKTLEEGLKVNPNHIFLTYDYINLLLDIKKYNNAKSAIEKTLKIDDRNKLLYFLYGYLEQHSGNLDRAELSYQKALELDETYFDSLYQLGLTYINKANKQLSPPNRDSQMFASLIRKSEYALNQAHEINPNDRPTILLLIEINTRKNRLDEVEELREKLEEF